MSIQDNITHREFSDQMGSSIVLPKMPERIVSLVPSQTELLFDLGLDDQVVGVTKFCVHPFDRVKTKTKIGGTKKFNFDIIDQLNPDLIIGNKEENYQDGIHFLQERYPVWMSDIFTLADAYQMMTSIGEIVGRKEEAAKMVMSIQQGFKGLQKGKQLKVLYLIWQKPYMAAGKNTFIDHILHLLGWENVINEKRYPEIAVERLAHLKPDLVLLSSEPFPFKEKHAQDIKQHLPSSNVMLVDGEMFSWYGSRLKRAVKYFESLLV